MNTTPLPTGTPASDSKYRFDLTKNIAEQIAQLKKLPPGEAIERIEEALPFLRRLNDPKSIYPAYIVLVQSHLILGAHDRAASHMRKRLDSRITSTGIALDP